VSALVEWQKGRINMRYLNFGFPSREEENILITAPKMKYSSLEEFMKSAIAFLAGKAEDEYDANLWLEYYKGYKLVDVEKCESRWELEGYDYSVNEDKKLIHVIIEPILHAYHIGPQSWDEVTWCLETDKDYIFYNWWTIA